MTQLSATDPFLLAEQRLLAPGELDRTRLAAALGSLHHHALDYADLYFQLHQHEAWSLEDGHVKDGSFSIERGLGVRAVVGDKTGFAYADEISRPALEAAVKSARAISRDGGNGISQAFQSARAEALYAPIDPLASLSEAKRIELMERVDAEARRHDPRIKQVFVSLASSRDLVLVAASDGTFAADVRPLVRLNVMVIAEHNGRRESGSAGGGGRVGYDYFVDDGRALEYAREAARQALVNLEAVAAPAGTMPVVLGPGWPGVLLHEAVGHGLEGDFNRKRTSAFAERMGDMVASTQCTVVDDGTLADRRGSLSIDDEGTATERTVLIENGRLTGYMQDKLNARLMGMAPTGNGRRESYAHLPMPRMTNTYMLAGEHDPGELIASVDRGLYAVNFGGGQVDITSGKFVFSASEAYLIEHGRVTRPVKGATLIGNGPEVLTRVSMVGSDMALDTGIGTCGKEGQSVPVGVGQPSMKVDALTVGGTSG